MDKNKRQAVVIGINKYKDANIPRLSGAVNDAKEISQRLKDNGDFTVADNHILLNEEADCKSIRKAVSDLLWQTDECELALLYFSGHGFQDGYGNGYIAPYDMVKDEPFVLGINMKELKDIVMLSPNKQCVLVILDCCYSGIPTKGDKSSQEIVTSFDSYFKEFDGKKEGEGKIIFASSGEDQKSREFEPDGANCHGIFTYHLLAGMDGEASDNAGTITLDSLHNYVDNKFTEKKQRPKFYAAGSSQLNQIKITVASDKFEKYISEKLAVAGNVLHETDSIDSLDLINSTCHIHEVLSLVNNNDQAVLLKKEINDILIDWRNLVNVWFNDNELDIRPKITRGFQALEDIVQAMKFQEIVKLDNDEKKLLVLLLDVSRKKITNERFVEKCGFLINPKNPLGPAPNSPNIR